jgi:hypothetical protein
VRQVAHSPHQPKGSTPSDTTKNARHECSPALPNFIVIMLRSYLVPSNSYISVSLLVLFLYVIFLVTHTLRVCEYSLLAGTGSRIVQETSVALREDHGTIYPLPRECTYIFHIPTEFRLKNHYFKSRTLPPSTARPKQQPTIEAKSRTVPEKLRSAQKIPFKIISR